MYAIETRQLQKRYGEKLAVADLTLDVPRGEVFGFLGPNGAGKSTSVKMLLGLVRPSAGSAQVLGGSPGDARVMAKVGFLPEHFRFHEWLHATEFLDLHGRLYGMPPDVRARRIPQLLEQVGLAEQARRPLAGFSKGMLQRIGLAQALINEPDLVFLDEPTSALDPFGRMLVRGVIQQLKARGATVFLNSHLLGEVEATCDRVAFIRQGCVLRTLTLRDFHPDHIQVTLTTGGLPPELLARLGVIAALSPFDPAAATAATAPHGATTLELVASDESCLPEIAQAVVQSGTPLYALNPRRTSLEQLFLEIVGSQDSGQ